jgi:putative ABC transport system permease protein
MTPSQSLSHGHSPTFAALGVAAIAAVGTVRASIQRALPPMVQRMVGRTVVRFTYVLPTPVNAWMASIAEKVSETTDFRSMIVVERDTVERGLTQVPDDLYPLIGETVLDPRAAG